MRYTQPQSGPVQIDWSNPITRGLRDVSVPAARADFVAVNTPTVSTGAPGIGFKGNGSSSYWRSAGTKSINAAAEHTIFALVQGAAAADSRVYTLADNSLIIQIGAGNVDATKLRLWERSPGVDVGTVSTTATVFEAARPHAAVLRYRIGVLESFVDGAADVTSAGTTAGAAALAQTGIGALVRASAPANYSAATLFLGLFWDRALSNAEIASISANPWQLFRSPQRMMLAAAAGPDVTVTLTGQATTAAAGSVGPSNAIPVAGSSATVAAGSVLVGSDVTVALAGQAVTASRGTLAPVATKALIGQSSTATPGSVSQATSTGLTGQASSAQQGLLTPARAIVISGQSGAASVGTIGPGTVAALTGQASATQQGVVATSGNKTVALTGQSISVAQGALTRSTPEAVFALATIMRQSAIAVQGGTMKSTVAAQGGTIKATIALSTIMRQSQINTRATMTNAPINRTVAFI